MIQAVLCFLLTMPAAAQLKDVATCLPDYDPDTRTWATSDRDARRAARLTGDGFATCPNAPNNGWQTRWAALTDEQQKDQIWDAAFLPWYNALPAIVQTRLDDATNQKMNAVDPVTYPDPEAITQPERKSWSKEQFFTRDTSTVLDFIERHIDRTPTSTTFLVAKSGAVANKFLNRAVMIPAIESCCGAIWIGTSHQVEANETPPPNRRAWAVPTLPEEQEDYLRAIVLAEGAVIPDDFDITSEFPTDWVFE